MSTTVNLVNQIKNFIYFNDIQNISYPSMRNQNLNLYLTIFNNNFYDHYSKHLSNFCSQISSVIYCNYCIKNINSDITVCIENHLNEGQDLSQIFTNLIFTLNSIYEKEKVFTNNILNTVDINMTITAKLISNYIHVITKVMKIYLKIKLEKFKENFIITEENTINESLRETLLKLNLMDICTIITKDYLKNEIKIKIEEFQTVHDKMILNDIINLFNDLYLEWGVQNLKVDSKKYKEEFIEYIKKIHIKTKTEQFFNIITNYPESHLSLVDIKIALTQNEQQEFILKVKDQISLRLLTTGVATPLIIEIFIRIIKMLNFIDPSSFILEMISSPIKKYLRQRKDTMRWIITTILSEEDSTIKEDLGKQYIKSTHSILNFNKDKENEYDNISSDEDEEEAERWHPLPITSSVPSNTCKFSDIISTLVNIFGSPEKFVEQYKKMLAERCVSDTHFSLENEIKNLELLKNKFGENLLQGCDIIIKDVKDSLKVNSMLESTSRTALARSSESDFNLNCLIINKNFWPFKDNTVFALEAELEKFNSSLLSNSSNIVIKNFDSFLLHVNNKLQNYKKKYSSVKLSRTLNFFSNIGYVDITLTFENGSFNFRVSPLSALIINLFDESNAKYFEHFTVEFISEKLKCSINDAKKKINFWVSKGVLNEISVNNPNSNRITTNINSTNKLIIFEDTKNYFIPNKVLLQTNLELSYSNNLIIEDDIFQFEYVESETGLNLENAINSIIKNAGPRNFEQIYKNLIISYQVIISEIKLKEVLGKMILEQKIFKEGDMYKLIVPTH